LYGCDNVHTLVFRLSQPCTGRPPCVGPDQERFGKQSTFKLKAVPGQVFGSGGEIFGYQHGPEAIGNNPVSLPTACTAYPGIAPELPEGEEAAS
jgi:hypothetical protein